MDVGGALDVKQLHELLAVGFSFPDYYGRNWDAFRDCVTTLDPMPDRIVVKGLKVLQEKLPAAANQLADCLDEFRTAPDLVHVKVEIE